MNDFFERLIDLNQYKILRKIISLLDLKVDFIDRFYLNFGLKNIIIIEYRKSDNVEIDII